MIQTFDERVAVTFLNTAKEDNNLNVTNMTSIVTGFARAGFNFAGVSKMLVTWRPRDERGNEIPNGSTRDYIMIGHFNEVNRITGKFIKIGIGPKLVFPALWSDEQKMEHVFNNCPIYWGRSRFDQRPFMTAGIVGDPAKLKVPSTFDFLAFLDDSLKDKFGAGVLTIGSTPPVVNPAPIVATAPLTREQLQAQLDALNAQAAPPPVAPPADLPEIKN